MLLLSDAFCIISSARYPLLCKTYLPKMLDIQKLHLKEREVDRCG